MVDLSLEIFAYSREIILCVGPQAKHRIWWHLVHTVFPWSKGHLIQYFQPACVVPVTIDGARSNWTFACGFRLKLKFLTWGQLVIFFILILQDLFMRVINICMQDLCAYLNLNLLWNYSTLTKSVPRILTSPRLFTIAWTLHGGKSPASHLSSFSTPNWQELLSFTFRVKSWSVFPLPVETWPGDSLIIAWSQSREVAGTF